MTDDKFKVNQKMSETFAIKALLLMGNFALEVLKKWKGKPQKS